MGRKSSSLVGKRFSMLKVIELVSEEKDIKKGRYKRTYRCECECGNTCLRKESSLKSKKNHIHSCGCYSIKNLTPADKQTLSKAGKIRAEKRNKDGMNVDMLFRKGTIKTNTSGVQGVSYAKNCNKWHVYVGYKNYRCNLGYIEDLEDAKKIT